MTRFEKNYNPTIIYDASCRIKEMRKLNKEACEQFNSLLRSVQASVSYMKFDNYLQALKIFIGFYNLRGMDK